MSSTTWKDRLPGGLADQKTPADFPAKKLEEGAETEAEEHTSDKSVAKEIAMDHMTEMGTDYYSALDKMEDGLRKQIKTAGDLAYLLGRRAVPRRSILKSAGDAKPVYHLAGRLYLSKSNWLLLSVPNALLHGVFDALDELGLEKPTRDTGDPGAQVNAHISVCRPAEVEQMGGPDAVHERGRMFRYQLGRLMEVEPDGWEGMSKVYFLEVESPELKKFRASYGLTPLPKYPFHLTVACRRKHVLGHNDVSKAAGFQSLLQMWEASQAHPVL